MAVRPATGTDRAAWDCFVRDRAGGNVLQAWGWGELKQGQGWRVLRLVGAADEDGRPAAWRGVCQVLSRSLGGGVRYAYAPRGPALADGGDGEAAVRILSGAARQLRRERVVRFSCDPEWPVGRPETAALLARCRLLPLGFDVQHRHTWLVDLAGGEAALWARLPAGTRRNVRLAERSGVVVERRHDPEAVDAFFPLYAETVGRQGYVGRPRAYLRELVAALGAAVFLARLDDQPVAGAIALAFGPRCCYLFGGTRGIGGGSRPGYPLHLAVMRWGIARGCTVYDMWGMPRRFDPADPHHGYAVFKTRWGGRIARHTGLLEVPLWPGADPLLRRIEALAAQRRPLLT
ncbi:MAG TPA: peptidoglycan bridge formation glycyltransferase FemA/FemB family protein [Verrucomicrobiae bacterium]|nr:peptidoglycan bridge formation glycyltransferase FemA/FemB family protein [Verrucomicrobiae bacterium]